MSTRPLRDLITPTLPTFVPAFVPAFVLALVMASFALVAAGCGEETVDKAEPVTFSDLRVEEVSASGAAIRFETSAPVSCVLEYGTAPDALDQTEVEEMEEPYMRDHEVWLTDLEAETTYYLRAVATDEDEREFLSEVVEFTTSAASAGQGVPGAGNLLNVASQANGGTIIGVSSNFGGAPNDRGFGANAAIDGDVGTEWSTDGDGDDAWVEIGLAAEKTIERVGFRSRKMADGTSIVESFKIVATGGADDRAERGPFETPDPNQTYYFELDERVSGTSFRFEAVTSTGGNTGAREVMLFSPAE